MNRLATYFLKFFRNVRYFFCGLKLSLEVFSLGSGAKILPGVLISGGKNISIGRRCFLGRGVILDARAGKIEIGDNVELRDGVRIYSRGIVIGKGVTLGESAFLNGTIRIHDGAWLSRGVDLAGEVEIEGGILGPYASVIASAGHLRNPETGKVMMSSKGLASTTKYVKVRICRGAWVGQRAILMKGVTVGENAIVGAGSVVTKDVSPGVTVVGVPSRKIKG